ncbi:histone H1-like [Hemicordylus capensis]|uniref:histone H1-like n=1 Tax=Hemicordylus capensis TaxID=884348 RepID=UPI0023027E59|nr:histone H1-like [Hemicordylus capensis]
MVRGSGQKKAALTEAVATSAVTRSQPASSGMRKNRLSGSLSQLILKAFETSNPRKGLSLAALKKFLAESGYNVSRNNHRLKRELHNLVSNGLLIRITGSGASGSFKFSSREKKGVGKSDPAKKKTAVVAKKPSAGNTEPPKKPWKKQPAVTKPKGPRNKTANPNRKQLATAIVAAKKKAPAGRKKK